MPVLPPRYAYRSRLGTGGAGRVDAVYDHARGEVVALKRPRAGAEALVAAEFWALTAFAHPRLVAAHDFLVLPDGSPAFTMALEPGPALADAGVQAEAAVRRWLPDLLDALAPLHRAGLVHGDLRAENVRLRPDGGAVLLDLGHLAAAGAWDGATAGSLAGLAPEGPSFGWRDRRADLYALGALLYRATTGRDPFPLGTDGAAGLLRAHRAEVPAPLGRCVPGISKALEALVTALLAKRPEDRPADVAEVRAALGLARGAAADVLLEGPLVGRAAALADLEARLGRAGAVALAGPPGSGRTRVLAQLRHEAQAAGRQVLAVDAAGLAGVAAEAVATAGAADPVAAALVRAHWGLEALRAPEPLDPEREQRRALEPLDPVREQRGAAEPLDAAREQRRAGEPLDAAREQLRAHAALVALAQAAWPAALWLVDDAERLDAGDRAAVRALRDAGEGRWSWLLVGDVPGLAAVALAPLDAPATGQLASAALGVDVSPAGLAEALAGMSHGRPGAARTLLAAWRRAGVLTADGFDAARAEALSADGIDAARAEGPLGPPLALPEAARALAAAASVLGPSGSLAELAAVFSPALHSTPLHSPPHISPEPAGDEAFGQALQALLAAGVLTLSGDRWRLTLPGAWRGGDVRALHARAFVARRPASDAAWPARVAAARHAALGQVADAWDWVLAGARSALVAHAINPAADLLADAHAALPGPADPALADRLALVEAHVLRARGEVQPALARLDDALLARLAARQDPEHLQALTTQGVLHQLAGRYAEALARYQAADALAAPDPAARVRARLFAGRTAFFLGDAPAAAGHLQAALEAAGDPRAAALRAWAEALWGHWLATRGGARAAEGRALLDAAVARAAAHHDPYHLHEACNNQGDAWLAAGRPAEAAAAFQTCRAIATRHGLANEAVFAHANLALADLARGQARSARDHARTALAAARAQGRRYPEGLAQAALGAAEVLAGEPAAGLARLAEALELARGLGHRYLELLARALRADAFALLGDRPAAEADLALAAAIAAETDNHEHDARLDATRAALGLPVALAAPRSLAELGAAELEQRSWLAPSAELDAEAGARGLTRLGAELAIARHDRGEACDLAAPLAAARAAGLALHEAALAARQGLATDDPAQRREAARRLREIAGPLPAAARARLAAHPAWAPAARDPLAADAEPVARLAGLVAELARAPDQAALLDRALGAFVDAAAAERGFLVLYDGLAIVGSRRVGRDEPGFTDFSLGLAHRVLFAGTACFLEDVQVDADLAARESVGRLGLRSVAAVPLRLGGRVVGVLIADSRIPREAPWGPEQALLTALADHLAAALAQAERAEAMRAERDAIAEAHDLALAAMAVPDPAALVLARTRARVGADAAWLLDPDHPAGPPPAALALTGLAGPLALPWEEAGAAGALWILPAGPGRTLVLLREAGGGPTAVETAALTRMAAVLAATLARP